jgi:ubiquinone/menaquinone biosynthesis C-methylase UbiE
MPPRIVSRQLSHPVGILGRVIGRLMNRHNARMNAFAVRQLALRSTDRVLEVGFGGGAALPALLERAGLVTGIDRSAEMVRWARSRFRAEASAGRADFREAAVETIPFPAAAFDKAYTVNTVYFWRSLAEGFDELHRVVAPGGRVVVGFLPKPWMDRLGHAADIFTSRTTDDVVGAMRSSGFHDVRIERPAPSTSWNVAIAIR